MKTFDEAKKIATSKNYDYLDPRNFEFDSDYEEFMSKIEVMKQNISYIIETNYADVWETLQGVRFLTRFEKVGNIHSFSALYNHRKHHFYQHFLLIYMSRSARKFL
jgi:hypothetical protein